MKKSRFTVIDALILIFAVAVIAVGVLKFAPGLFKGGESKEVNFTVLVSGADEGTGDIIKAGDKVSISFSETAYAEITGVEENPYKVSEFNNVLGRYISHEIEEKCELKIYAKCKAAVSDTKIANGEVPIRVGLEMPIRGKGYTVKGYVIEVED